MFVNCLKQIQRELESWGLQFSREIVKFPARCLKPQTIAQGGGASCQAMEGDWSRSIQRKLILKNV